MPSNNHKNQNERRENATMPAGIVRRRQLLQCMAETLTPRQYQVFVLSFLEGMPQQDIAREMGLSKSTVSRHCTEARYRMRLALGYEMESYSYDPETTIYPDQPHPIRLPGCVPAADCTSLPC